MSTTRLDEIREQTMARVQRSERWFKGLVIASGCTEVLGLVALLWVADFGDRTHVLILVATIMVYWVLALWTWALAAHASMNAQRILRAITAWREDG